MLLEIHAKAVKPMGEDGEMIKYASLSEGGVAELGEAVGFGPQPDQGSAAVAGITTPGG